MLLYVSVDICFIFLIWILPFQVLYLEILLGFVRFSQIGLGIDSEAWFCVFTCF